MTENEAIVQLNFDMEMIRFNPDTGETLTLEQIKAHNEDNYKTYLADEVAITALLEIQQYRAIGTIDEFKALKEKAEPKKVAYQGEHEKCPTCGSFRVFGKYCTGCGQRLNWGNK